MKRKSMTERCIVCGAKWKITLGQVLNEEYYCPSGFCPVCGSKRA